MPRPLCTLGKDAVPIVQEAGWDSGQGRSAQMRKISPPPAFDPRIVQTVANHYTAWATRPNLCYSTSNVWRNYHFKLSPNIFVQISFFLNGSDTRHGGQRHLSEWSPAPSKSTVRFFDISHINVTALTARKGNHKLEEKQTQHSTKPFLCHVPVNSFNFIAFHLAALTELTSQTVCGLLYLVWDQLRDSD
jgi:hypothetical protein